jgi:fluoroacetyl-CoA thioesterase
MCCPVTRRRERAAAAGRGLEQVVTMKPSLKPGLTYRRSYTVQDSKTVPYTYPESREVDVDNDGQTRRRRREMAHVDMHADAALSRIEMPGQQFRAGPFHQDDHEARRENLGHGGECVEVVGERIAFNVRAHDGIDLIGEGRHERFVVQWDRFKARVAPQATKVAARVA